MSQFRGWHMHPDRTTTFSAVKHRCKWAASCRASACGAREESYGFYRWRIRRKTTKSACFFSLGDASWLHLASKQPGRANLTLASAAQASSKWMEVKLGDQATEARANLTGGSGGWKWLTTRIRRLRSPPGTGSGSAPGLPISSCWPPVGKTRVSLSATFLQHQPLDRRLHFLRTPSWVLRARPEFNFPPSCRSEAARRERVPSTAGQLYTVFTEPPPRWTLQNHRPLPPSVLRARFQTLALVAPSLC